MSGRAAMRSSWPAPLGPRRCCLRLLQKTRSDSRRRPRDVWTSCDALRRCQPPRALGWRRDRGWAYEVRLPRNVDCTVAEPSRTATLAEWMRRGYLPARGRAFGAADIAEEASLLLPEGTYGPGFLTLKNYYALKDYISPTSLACSSST